MLRAAQLVRQSLLFGIIQAQCLRQEEERKFVDYITKRGGTDQPGPSSRASLPAEHLAAICSVGHEVSPILLPAVKGTDGEKLPDPFPHQRKPHQAACERSGLVLYHSSASQREEAN